MAIEWNDSLATGDAQIDQQHRELFSRVNRLLSACGGDSVKQTVLDTVDFLDQYVRTHFAAEEELMRASRYSGYDTHRQQHLDFVGQVAELRAAIDRSPTGTLLTVMANRVLVDWLVEHVKKVDKALALHLRAADR